jgi:hypothetical protein
MKKIFTILSASLLAGMFAASAETVVVSVLDYDWNEIAQPFESDLILNEDGSLTLSQFFNSGYPASFKFEDGGVEAYSASFEMTGNLDRSDTYPYLLTPDGDYMTCYAYAVGGGPDDWTAIYWPYVFDSGGYSWVYRYDMSDPENIYEYMGYIALSGSVDKGDGTYTWPYYYLSFFFNMPEPLGVESVASDTEAPVEYYNLNGLRVTNPENGLYIRRQGSAVSKVMLK